MKYLELRTNWSKKATSFGVLGAVAVAPLLGALQTAQAAPPDHAPAHGYRRRAENRNTAQRTTLSGVVTSDYAGNGFTMRTDNGRTFQVRTNNEPRRLTRGDRVSVYGYADGGLFIAESLRITQNDGDWDRRNGDWDRRNGDWDRRGDGWDWNDRDNSNQRRVTVSGIVTRDLRSENAFEIRTNNGRTLRVRTRNTEPRRLNAGDRVEVTGTLNTNNDRLRADSVRVINDRNSNYERNLNGVVTRDVRGNQFEVRTDNGRTVLVRSRDREPLRLTRGDRVLVQGRFDQNRNEFIADDVRITRNDDGWSKKDKDDDKRVEIYGTVVGTSWMGAILTVRRDDGKTFRVQPPRTSSNFRDGDRVRVVGYKLGDGRIQADSVSRQ